MRWWRWLRQPVGLPNAFMVSLWLLLAAHWWVPWNGLKSALLVVALALVFVPMDGRRKNRPEDDR